MLAPCTHCKRPHRELTICPFCGVSAAPKRDQMMRASVVAAALASAAWLAGCPSSQPADGTQPSDPTTKTQPIATGTTPPTDDSTRMGVPAYGAPAPTETPPTPTPTFLQPVDAGPNGKQASTTPSVRPTINLAPVAAYGAPPPRHEAPQAPAYGGAPPRN